MLFRSIHLEIKVLGEMSPLAALILLGNPGNSHEINEQLCASLISGVLKEESFLGNTA